MNNNIINIDNFSRNFDIAPSQIDQSYKRPRAFLLIFIYYLSTLIISLFIQIGIIIVNTILEYLLSIKIDTAILNSLSMTLTYLATLIFLIPFSFQILKNDFKIAFKKPFKIFFFSAVFFLGFTVLSDLYYIYIEPNIIKLFVKLNFLDQNIVNSNTVSGNQQSIESLLQNKVSALILIPSIIIIGPFVEELIFRKGLFRAINFKNNIINILISGLIFALIHVLTTIFATVLYIISGIDGYNFQHIILELIYLWGYFLSGIMLGTIYVLTGQNITIVFIVHLLNNLIATLQVI